MWLRLAAFVVAGTTAVVATPVQAQTQFDFTPHVGMYFPFNAAVSEAPDTLMMRQLTAVVLGGHVAMHVSRHWLLEGSLDYSPSPVAVTDEIRTVDRNGGMLLGSVRVAYRIGRLKPKTPELQLSAGAGLVNRFGAAWKGHEGRTDPAAVLGLAGRYPLGKYLPVNVRIEIKNYITRAQFQEADGRNTTAWRNHDTIWSVGFEIPMNGPER